MHELCRIFLCISVIVLASCSHAGRVVVPSSWVKEDVGEFTFYRPRSIVPVPVQGIDSKVGRYESSTIELGFDYSGYADDLTINVGGSASAFHYFTDSIAGRTVRIAINYYPTHPFPNRHVIAVHFDSLGTNKNGALTMYAWCRDTVQFDTAVMVFRSIRIR